MKTLTLLASFLLVFAAAAARADQVVGFTSDGVLVTFDSASPQTLTNTRAITGMRQDELVLAADFRPTDGALFVLGSTSRLYRLDRETGAAIALTASPFIPGLVGSDFGMTFDTSGSLARVSSDSGQNLVLDSENGLVSSVDATLRYATGDANAGAVAGVVALATRTTTQSGTVVYGIDLARGLLVTLESPSAGTVRSVGPLGLTGLVTGGYTALDVSPSTGALYALLAPNDGGASREYLVNVTTGGASPLGAASPVLLRAGAMVPSSPPAPPATPLLALVGSSDLVKFTVGAPQTLQTSVHVRGLPLSDALVGIAVRPSTGILYAITRTALYDVDLVSGSAQRVGNGFAEALPAGTDLSCDFDPALDALRVVGGSTVNVKIDPRTGVLAPANSSFAFATGDLHEGAVPAVHAIAFVGRASAGLVSRAYVLDRNSAILARLGTAADAPDEARTGILHTIGPLSIDGVSDLPANLGLVTTGDTTAYCAVHTTPTASSLYHVDLGTGAAEFVGAIGAPGAVRALTVQATANPPRMDIAKMNASLHFRRVGHDSLTLRGDIPFLGGGGAGATVTVDVDGLVKTFVLNSKGRATSDDDTLRIGGSASRGTRLRIALRREDLVSAFADEGMDGALFARRAPAQVVITVTVEGHTYRTPVDVSYSAVPLKSGSVTTQ